MSNIQMARVLGWTSLAVGALEITATRKLEDEMGIDDHHTLIRAFGIREIAAGVMILSQPGITDALANSLWARVAGDAADVAMLGIAASTTRRPTGLMAIIAIVLAITGLDIFVASRIQTDLNDAKVVSADARNRVTPMAARPAKATTVEA